MDDRRKSSNQPFAAGGEAAEIPSPLPLHEPEPELNSPPPTPIEETSFDSLYPSVGTPNHGHDLSAPPSSTGTRSSFDGSGAGAAEKDAGDDDDSPDHHINVNNLHKDTQVQVAEMLNVDPKIPLFIVELLSKYSADSSSPDEFFMTQLARKVGGGWSEYDLLVAADLFFGCVDKEEFLADLVDGVNNNCSSYCDGDGLGHHEWNEVERAKLRVISFIVLFESRNLEASNLFEIFRALGAVGAKTVGTWWFYEYIMNGGFLTCLSWAGRRYSVGYVEQCLKPQLAFCTCILEAVLQSVGHVLKLKRSSKAALARKSKLHTTKFQPFSFQLRAKKKESIANKKEPPPPPPVPQFKAQKVPRATYETPAINKILEQEYERNYEKSIAHLNAARGSTFRGRASTYSYGRDEEEGEGHAEQVASSPTITRPKEEELGPKLEKGTATGGQKKSVAANKTDKPKKSVALKRDSLKKNSSATHGQVVVGGKSSGGDKSGEEKEEIEGSSSREDKGWSVEVVGEMKLREGEAESSDEAFEVDSAEEGEGEGSSEHEEDEEQMYQREQQLIPLLGGGQVVVVKVKGETKAARLASAKSKSTTTMDMPWICKMPPSTVVKETAVEVEMSEEMKLTLLSRVLEGSKFRGKQTVTTVLRLQRFFRRRDEQELKELNELRTAGVLGVPECMHKGNMCPPEVAARAQRIEQVKLAVVKAKDAAGKVVARNQERALVVRREREHMKEELLRTKEADKLRLQMAKDKVAAGEKDSAIKSAQLIEQKKRKEAKKLRQVINEGLVQAQEKIVAEMSIRNRRIQKMKAEKIANFKPAIVRNPFEVRNKEFPNAMSEAEASLRLELNRRQAETQLGLQRARIGQEKKEKALKLKNALEEIEKRKGQKQALNK